LTVSSLKIIYPFELKALRLGTSRYELNGVKRAENAESEELMREKYLKGVFLQYFPVFHAKSCQVAGWFIAIYLWLMVRAF